jgi:type III pantothenate kinase
MLLAIDIGNSTISCGVFDHGTLTADWRFPTDPARSADEYDSLLLAGLQAAGIEPALVTGIALSSVVPALTSIVECAAKASFHVAPLVASADLDTGLKIGYTHPRELGMDRLVAAAAAYARYRSRVIIVDLGTATTFSVVNEAGEFLGGAIAPGLCLSAKALVSRTAQLLQVELAPPPTVIGRDTRSSIQSGLLFGHATLVDGMIERMQNELGQRARVIATGGLAPVLAPLCRSIDEVRPHLTLEGLEWLSRRLADKKYNCGG